MALLEVSFFGPLELTLGTKALRLESDKARGLLIYLLMEADRGHRRDALAGLLWPEQEERSARHNLSQALHNLRSMIGDSDAAEPLLLATRDAIGINPRGSYRCDVTDFLALLGHCATHSHRSLDACPTCNNRLTDAVAVYRGDFLAQFFLPDCAAFEEWAGARRASLRQRVSDALSALTRYYSRIGQGERAAQYARRRIELDPWDEDASRHLMRLLAAQGQRNLALAEFERCRTALATELGVEPEAETMALAQAVAAGLAENATFEIAGAEGERSPSRLPAQLTPFVGRQTELRELGEMLSDAHCRLLTIVGPGGIGKTRLALAAAAQQAPVRAEGARFVPLADVQSVEQLPRAIAGGIGLASEVESAQQLVGQLRDKDLLLLLDNFERVVEGGQLASQILAGAPRVTILVTSRERLGLSEEWMFPVGGLDAPEPGTVSGLETFSAVALFLQSARRVRRDFAPGPADLAAIAEICRLVEGMPLAIELAASWVRVLSCPEIAAQVSQDLRLLASASRSPPPRHSSICAVMDESWRLLAESEQATLRRCAVFRGSFDREAATAVTGAPLESLAALVDKSLLRATADGRFTLHELTRKYAEGRLAEAGEEQVTRKHHFEHYLSIAEAVTPDALAGPQQVALVKRLEREHDNFRGAFVWSLDPGGDAELSLRLAGALGRFWDMRGYVGEGRRWLALALQAAEAAQAERPVAPASLTKALVAAGALALCQSDYAMAEQLHRQALRLAEEGEDLRRIAICLSNVANVMYRKGEYVEGRALHERALGRLRKLGDQAGVARSLLNMGEGARLQGDYDAAQVLYEESLSLRRQLGDRYGIALILGNLGYVAARRGNLGEAERLLRESLELRQAGGDERGIVFCLRELAYLATLRGNYAEAWALYEQSLGAYLKLGDRGGLAIAMEGGAQALIGLCRAREAARLLGVAAALRGNAGYNRSAAELPDYERTVSAAREALGADQFAAEWEAGSALDADQTIASLVDSTATRIPCASHR